MDEWSGVQRAFAVKSYYKNNDCLEAARREFRRNFQLRRHDKVPSAHAIKTWVENFETTGSALSKKSPGRRKSTRTPEAIEDVRTSFLQSPQRSARRHAVSLGLSRRTLGRILFQDLKFHPYKLQVVHELKAIDLNNRVMFAEQFLAKVNENEHFLENLWMSDEAHFHLNGCVNKQNYRYWSRENPRQLHQRPLYGQKVTVWCALSTKGIIGPYFFENEDGNPVTVNSQRYVRMVETFFSNELERFPVNESTWFQQDGAMAHTARISIASVRNLFGNHIISRNGDIPWPARSPDFSACDFFLWGFLKSRVFARRPHNIIELKANICEEINVISIEMLQKVMGDMCPRMQECIRREGGHLQDVIFKK